MDPYEAPGAVAWQTGCNSKYDAPRLPCWGPAAGGCNVNRVGARHLGTSAGNTEEIRSTWQNASYFKNCTQLTFGNKVTRKSTIYPITPQGTACGGVGPSWGSDTQMTAVLAEHSAWIASSEQRPQEPGCQPAPPKVAALAPWPQLPQSPAVLPPCAMQVHQKPSPASSWASLCSLPQETGRTPPFKGSF